MLNNFSADVDGAGDRVFAAGCDRVAGQGIDAPAKLPERLREAVAAARARLRVQREHMAAQEGPRRPLVVVIEDDDATREMYRLGLELAGFDVAGFPDDSGVARLLDTRIPDVVVLDWQLSGFLTGADILINLRRDSRTEHTPVVFLSNYPSQIGRDEPVWLLKSETTPADLASRLRRVLRSPSSQEIPQPTQP